jgi:hypothetical protein
VDDLSPQDTVPFAEYSSIGLAVLVGLVLALAGYRIGNAHTARWILACFGLVGPAATLAVGLYSGRTGNGFSMLLVAALAAAAGALLTRHADSDLPWEVIGITIASAGLFFNATAYRGGPPPSGMTTLLIAGGLAFGVSSALVTLLRNVEHPATALSLGLLAMSLGAYAMETATVLSLRPNASEAIRLSLPITSMLAALGILALLGISRARTRTQMVSAEPTVNTVRMTDQ